MSDMGNGHTRAILSAAALFGLFLAGCDCAGPATGSACESDLDCASTDRCVDRVCVARADASGDPTDAGPGRPDTGPGRDADLEDRDAGPCREVSGESTVEAVPVDIIIAIDNSGSMSEEAAEVRRNINEFARIIGESGLDYRVVLISTPTGSRGVCVDPPLGSGAPECRSGPDGRLLALHVGVASRNAPNLVLSNYPMYRDFLRFEAAKVFVWITDDESGTFTADSFRAALEALEPSGMFRRSIHNAIVGFYGDTPATWSTTSAGACASLARVGAIYLRLANCLMDDGTPIADCTSGRQARVCETDWTPIFTDIARGVVEGVPVECDFAVPEPPMGQTIDFSMVGVTWRSGGTEVMPLGRVDGLGACTADGWYYDDPAAPTTIVLCPELCRAVQADPDARMDIALGCFGILD
ncbi:MAG: hypothetical protein KF729_08770 [Sandaracinaceae bacterium]|nr:hypothetical protein [Sandaracinaceae bacterium]